MKTIQLKKIILSGIFLALCMVLPFLTNGELAIVLSPMHIPVLLCGFVCGWQYGLTVGFIAPLLSFVFFGMPPIFPIGVSMVFELAIYGFCTGLFYKALPKKTIFIYVNLITSMIAGRIVWGIARYALAGLLSYPFSLNMFLSGAFITAMPGIVLHIVLIPLIIIPLQKSNLMLNVKKEA